MVSLISLFTLPGCVSPSQTPARQKLNQVLGAPEDHALAPPGQAPSEQGLSHDPFFRRFFSDSESRDLFSPFRQFFQERSFDLGGLEGQESASIQVKNTDKAYIITVPLSKAEDAKNIHLKVTDHQIALEGQVVTEEKNTNGQGESRSSSSFMQSFSTPETLLVDKVQQATLHDQAEGLLRVFTIPKKEHSGVKKGMKGMPPVTPSDTGLSERTI